MVENKEYKINNDMIKNKIRITENELKQIVNESVKRVLRETYNYNDAMSDRNETLSVDDILNDLKENNIQVKECPSSWLPANWEDFLWDATEIGYDSEEVKKCILEHLNTELIYIQNSIKAVKEWGIRE